MMVPVAKDNFVRTLIRDRRGELKSSLVVPGKSRVVADARPKTVSFDLSNLENNEKRQERRRRRRRRVGGSDTTTTTSSICEDRWGSALPDRGESCSCLSMPQRNMSPYVKKPEPTSPGRITQALLLQNLSDHLPELLFSDEEQNDDLDSSTFSRTPLRKVGNHPPQQQQQQREQLQHHAHRSPEQIADALAFDMCLEMSPEFFRLGDEDEDDSSVSTDCSFF